MLQGNRKFILFLICMLAPIAFALLGNLTEEKALDFLNMLFATYVVGNIGEHGVQAYKERKK